jgi:uncharacterized protein YcnI
MVWRLGILAAAASVTVLVAAGPAMAHVTVSPGEATQGGFTTLAFQVPTESDTASTTKVEVNIPTQTPIASLSVKPVPGWTAAVVTTKLTTPIKGDEGEDITEVISKITWTAAGADAGVKPGQFQEFEVSAGPLPAVDQIIFKVLQTYSDGTIVRWIDEPPAAGAPEPEHPAPVLTLAKSAKAPASAGPTSTGAVPAAGNGDGDGNGWALGVGVAALITALAALAVAVLAWRRTS